LPTVIFQQDEELEEDMKDEIDSMKGLLDKMNEERQEELVSTQVHRNSCLNIHMLELICAKCNLLNE